MEEPNNEQDEEPVVLYLTVERIKAIMWLTAIVDWSTRLLYAMAIFYLGKSIFYNEMYLTPDIVAATAIAFLIRRYMEYLANVKFYGIYLAVQLFMQSLKEKETGETPVVQGGAFASSQLRVSNPRARYCRFTGMIT